MINIDPVDSFYRKFKGQIVNAYTGQTGMRWTFILNAYAQHKVKDIHDFQDWIYRLCKSFDISEEDMLDEYISTDINQQMEAYLDDHGEWPNKYAAEMDRIRFRAPFYVFKKLIHDYNKYLVNEKPVRDAIKKANTETGLNTDF